MLLAAGDVPAQELLSRCNFPYQPSAVSGSLPAAPALKTAPADLTQISRRNGGKFPVFRVANVIRGYGAVAAHGSREMPVWGSVFRAFGDELSVKLRVDNLTSYLETLQGK